MYNLVRSLCYDCNMAVSLVEAFGQVLRTHRERRGWSQMMLASEAGLHLNAVGNLERGKRGPTLQTLFLLCRALDVPVAHLVADIEKAKPAVK